MFLLPLIHHLIRRTTRTWSLTTVALALALTGQAAAADPFPASTCHPDPAGNAYADIFARWDHNLSGGTSPAGVIEPAANNPAGAVGASAANEAITGITAAINSYDLNIRKSTLGATVNTSKYLQYAFTTASSFAGQHVELYGLAAMVYNSATNVQATGAYSVRLEVSTSATFTTSTVFKTSVAFNNGSVGTADAAAAPSNQGSYFQTFLHWNADNLITLQPSTTYYVRVYPYAPGVTGYDNGTPYPNDLVLFDDFMLKAKGCNVAPTAVDVTNAAMNSTAGKTGISALNATDTDGGTIQSYTVSTAPAASQGTLYLADGVTVVGAGTVLTPAQAAALKFQPNPSFSGNATFTFTATDNNGAVDATPATFTIPVTPVADLSVTKTDGVLSVNAGGPVAYTIRVSNAGPNSATGAVLRDAAVSGLNVTGVACSGTPGQCTAGTTPSVAQLQAGYALPTLASGQYYELTVTGTVTAASGTVSNTATVTAPGGTTDSSTGNNTATDSDTVNPVADLTLTKTNGGSSVASGSTTTYTLTLTNTGPSSAGGTVLTDPAATGLSKTSVSCVAAGGAVCPSVTTSTLESGVTVATLPSGGSITVTVGATVTATGGSVTNSVTAALPSGTTDPTPTGTVSDTDTVLIPDLTVTKTHTGTWVQGDTGRTYSITVTNTGGSATTGTVSVTDTLPTGLSATAITGSGWTCTLGSLTCTRSDALAAGSSYPVITVTVDVSATAPGSVTNSVSVSGGGEVNTGNNTATDPTTITVAGADVSVTKSGPAYARPSTAQGASLITYTLTVRNNGPVAATGVVVTDTLPGALTYVSSTPSATVSGQTVTWSVGNLANGATQTLTVTVRAPDEATLEGTPGARSVTNTASVSAAGLDGNTGNNTATATTDLVYAKLVKSVRNVTKGTAAGTSGSGLPTEVLEYCIDAVNYGNAALPNFVLVDHVPATTTARTTAYDAEEPSTDTGFGVKVTRGTTSYTKGLTATGGAFNNGTMTVNLGTLNVGETGRACFQATIQ